MKSFQDAKEAEIKIEQWESQWAADSRPRSLDAALDKMDKYKLLLEGVRNDPLLSRRSNTLIRSMQELIKTFQDTKEAEIHVEQSESQWAANPQVPKPTSLAAAFDKMGAYKILFGKVESNRELSRRMIVKPFQEVNEAEANISKSAVMQQMLPNAQVQAVLEFEVQNLLSSQILQHGAQAAEMSSCLADLQRIVDPEQNIWHVAVYGSATNGYGTSDSDLDVVVYESGTKKTREDNVAILRSWATSFEESELFTVKDEIFQASVPIIKLLYRSTQEVDLSVNNIRPLLNTRLLKAYSTLDKRVAQLGKVVKFWAKCTGNCGARDGHLSSYAFILMSIYFLQVSDVELPCLQQKGALDNIVKIDNTAASLSTDQKTLMGTDQTAAWTLDEDLSLSNLLCKFFHFYAHDFRWGLEVVSVRLGCRSKADAEAFELLRNRGKVHLHIEDPFERQRNLADVLQHEQHLKRSFATGSRALQEGHFTKILSGRISKPSVLPMPHEAMPPMQSQSCSSSSIS
jgi:DNA polymerase sigma